MNDIQQDKDTRQIELSGAGVSAYRRPILISETKLGTVGTFNLSTTLGADKRGTHMSRLTQILESFTEWDLDMQTLAAQDACKVLNAQTATLISAFDFFYEACAPISKLSSLLPATVTVRTTNSGEHTLSLSILATTLCPCSQAISENGAHNQRARLTVQGQLQGGILPIIKMLEQQASAPLYGVLKRSDEKFVTEQAWENGKLVEDVVRDIVIGARSLAGFNLEYALVENEESIHAHDAWASYGQRII